MTFYYGKSLFSIIFAKTDLIILSLSFFNKIFHFSVQVLTYVIIFCFGGLNGDERLRDERWVHFTLGNLSVKDSMKQDRGNETEKKQAIKWESKDARGEKDKV